MSEKICLKWNDFPSRISRSLAVFRQERLLCDVMLLTVDEVQFSAHQLVLSSCSHLFKSIFSKNVHPQPLIYLSDVTSEILGLFLDYIYNGQATVSQAQLQVFLKVAEKLKISELAEEVTAENDDHHIENSKDDAEERKRNVQRETLDNNFSRNEFLLKEEDVTLSKGRETTVYVNASVYNEGVTDNDDGASDRDDGVSDHDDEDSEHDEEASNHDHRAFEFDNEGAFDDNDSVSTMKTEPIGTKPLNSMTESLKKDNQFKKNLVKKNGYYQCQDCDYFSKLKNPIVRHVERHIEGLNYKCRFCDKNFKTQETHEKHARQYHPNEKGKKVDSKLKVTEMHFISIEPREKY